MHLRGEVRCVLCLRTVVYSDGSQFEDHMRQSHGAQAEAGNLDIILAVCFMDAEERAVKNIIFEKIIKSEAETEEVCEIVMVDEDSKDDNYENDTNKKCIDCIEIMPHDTATITKSLNNIATATVNTSEGEKRGNKEKGMNVGKGKEFHICKVCKKMFAWKNSLSMHEKNYHSKAESSCSQSVSVSRKVNKRRNKTIGS